MTCPRRHLGRDQRGAVLVVALFASTLLLGMLYYVLGVGRAIHHGEVLQDASDAGAFSAAVVGARGMNLMALLNMVQLSVTAISVALLAVVLGAVEAIAWIKRRFWRRILYGWTIPFLAWIAIDAATTYMARKATFDAILSSAEKAQEVLREELVLFAEMRASDMAASFEGVDGALLAPAHALPTEDGDLLDFCARLYPFARSITDEAFDSVPSGRVRGKARGYAKDRIVPLCLTHGVTGQRLADDARLGTEHYQLRAYATGDELRQHEENGVRIATWRRDEDGGNVAALRRALGQIAMAQAEFYFDGNQAQAEMLWHMQWTARMRRFRDADDYGAFVGKCAARGGGLPCTEIAQALRAAEELIIH